MEHQNNMPAADVRPGQGPSAVLKRLHEQCVEVVVASLKNENEVLLGESYVFANDLEGWHSAISELPEASLLATAEAEYILAMLNACQGQYRNAFKGLRLVLELCIQSVHLSANLVARAEWLKGERDTVWSALVDPENGPLSTKFCRAFFPDLCEHTGHFRQLTQTLYRELSECIHGNVPNHIPLPSSIEFSLDTFSMWHSKARLVRLVVHFAFTLRYLRTLPKERRSAIEAVLLEQLGHIPAIRTECTGA